MWHLVKQTSGDLCANASARLAVAMDLAPEGDRNDERGAKLLRRGAQAVKLQVTGMHCSACSSAVERALGALPGVRSAAVSLTMQQADVVRAPGGASEVRPPPPWGCGSRVRSGCRP